jgi:hypothetical protein
MRAFGRALFNDRARPWVAMGLLLVIAILGHETAEYAVEREGGARRCFVDPSICADEELVLSLWHVLDTQSDGYRVSRLGHVLSVQGSPEGLLPGGRVSLRGHFDGTGTRLIEQERMAHPLWRLKRNFSIVGALGVFFWLLSSVRLGAGGLLCRG